MLILNKVIRGLSISLFAFVLACQPNVSSLAQQDFAAAQAKPKLSEIESAEIRNLLESAIEQTNLTKGYDPKYVALSYPNGDVPLETGVCSDVVIRAFRKAGVDLQKEVHEDMTANFSLYPKNGVCNRRTQTLTIAACRICKHSLRAKENL